MKEDERVMKERMGELSRDLSAVSQEFKEKSASLRSVEELKSQTSHLDHEIKQKSEVSQDFGIQQNGEITEHALCKYLEMTFFCVISVLLLLD